MLTVRRAGAVLAGVAVLAAPGARPQDKPRDGARQQSRVIVPDKYRSLYESWGFAPAIVTRDGTIYVSGVVSRLEGEGTYEARYAAGLKKAIQRIEELLAVAGATLDDVIDITSYHTDLARQLETAVKARKEVMRPPHPSWTAVGTTALASPDGVTEVRVIAKLPAPK
jgi:enamine deaminase RidA (YjgF/YER057c/UK114 family)